MTRPRRLFFRTAIAAAAFLITLIAAEAVLRFTDYPPEKTTGWKAYLINELGYRGRPIAYAKEDFVVVLLGDSQVEAVCSLPNELPEMILEQELSKHIPKARVFTLGATGYGIDQEVLALSQYFRRYRADLVIIWETFANDVWNNLFPTNWPGNEDGIPKPTFRLDGDGSLHDPSTLPGEPLYKTRLGALITDVLDARSGSQDSRWTAGFPDAVRPVSTPPDPAIPVHKLNEQENPVNEKSHFSVFFNPPSPRTIHGLNMMRALLLRTKLLAAQHNAAFLSFQEDRSTEYAGTFATGKPEFYVEHHGAYYRCSIPQYRSNIAYVHKDLAYFSIPITEPHYRVSKDDPHFNTAGNRQVLNDLVKRILDAKLLPARQ